MSVKHLSPMKKRNVLTSKNVNIRNQGIVKGSNNISPRKTKLDVEQALNNSPIRKVTVSPVKVPYKSLSPSSGVFTFFEESEEDRAAALIKHVSLRRKTFHDENDYEKEQENKDFNKTKEDQLNQYGRSKTAKRVPLQDLSITLFPGTIKYQHSSIEQPLNLHLNHKQILPEYITPPRNNKLKDFFTAKRGETNSTSGALTTDDIPTNKVIRKLQFNICEN